MSNFLRACSGSGSRDTDHNAGKQLRHKIRMVEANMLSGQTLKRCSLLVVHMRAEFSFRATCLHKTFPNLELGSPRRWTKDSLPFISQLNGSEM